MESISATKFKEQCLVLLDEVGPEGLVITKHGTPVAKLIPIQRAQKPLIGSMRGELEIDGDIMGTGEAWDAQP